MVPEVPESTERWTAKRRVAVVVGILKSETIKDNVARIKPLRVA
jgi:hypothetical protein